MPPRKNPLAYSEAVLKNTLALAGDKVYKRSIRNTHGDLLITWGIVQSVFGAQARPEHAVALLAHFSAQVDEETTDLLDGSPMERQKPRKPRSRPQDDSDDSDDLDDEEDDEDEDEDDLEDEDEDD